MLPLDKRQREILDYLNEFIQTTVTRRASKRSAGVLACRHWPRSTST